MSSSYQLTDKSIMLKLLWRNRGGKITGNRIKADIRKYGINKIAREESRRKKKEKNWRKKCQLKTYLLTVLQKFQDQWKKTILNK